MIGFAGNILNDILDCLAAVTSFPGDLGALQMIDVVGAADLLVLFLRKHDLLSSRNAEDNLLLQRYQRCWGNARFFE
jgi:hypothetical protein